MEPIPRSKRVSIAAAIVFAFVSAVLFYLVSTGHMALGLALIADVMALGVLAFIARKLS